MILPSRTITAPTGTSSASYAFCACRNASRMKYSSVGRPTIGTVTTVKSGQYRRMYRESIQQPAKFWAREASELVWRAKWKKVLEWKAPFAKWFVGGKLNISENCLDRHLTGARRNKAAIMWEGEPGDKRTL